jgi:tyrosine-protein kinase Etk/Wzc
MIINRLEGANEIPGKNLANSKQIDDFDFGKIVSLILRKWYIILFFSILGYFIADIYLRYTTPSYAAGVSLLLKDTKYSAGSSESSLFQDLGILNTSRNIDNEISILKTISIMEEVVKRLRLNFIYENKGRLKSTEYYKNSPVYISNFIAKDTTINKNYVFEIEDIIDDRVEITFDEKAYSGLLGKEIVLPFGMITLNSSINDYKKWDKENSIIVSVLSLSSAASRFSRQLRVSIDEKSRGTIIKLNFTDPIKSRATDILNEVINVYNENELGDKNRIYSNTLDFINERLNVLVKELKQVESNVAKFKSETGAINLATESGILLSESSLSNRDLIKIDSDIFLATGIRRKLLENPLTFEIVPTIELLTTPSLGGLINTFNSMVMQRETLLNTVGSKHPDIILVEKQLSNLRKNIIENINVAEDKLLNSRRTILDIGKDVSGRIRVLPETEKDLLEIQRQQSIKEELFLYLLQKREETALILRVSVANNRIIEPVRSQGQVSPKSKQIRLVGISLGFLLPIFFILATNLLNTKVILESQIQEQTSVPILGVIPYSQHKGHLVIDNNKRSASAELFRLIRANLQFLGSGANTKLILVSSSMSGEGKSFISLNLGVTLCIAGKKVLIIELDLRKPKIASYLGFKAGDGKGISDYLVDESINLDQIIYKSHVNPNLYFIPCGSIPPNPTELLLSERLSELFQSVRSKFDRVFIDTPPIGLVSDALLLSTYGDLTFFIVRQNFTEKRQLKIPEELKINKKMPRIFIIFNGVKYGVGGYGYGDNSGYGYSYSNGYGYYDRDGRKRSFIERVKSLIFYGKIKE